MPNERKTVMISSTVRDLPEHRKEVMDACLKQGMFPIMMEHLPANDDEAISSSLKMVDEADIYVGVFAQRYGYIPKGKKRNPKQISVTEMEYDRAVKRKIPRLIFVMDKTHAITIDDIDIEHAAKLKAFKERVQARNIVNFFKSSPDLRSHVINSLSKHLDPFPIRINKNEVPTIDLDTYFNAIRKRYGVLALEGLTPPQKEEYLQIQLSSVFVEQNVRENPPPFELPKEVWQMLRRKREIHEEDLPRGITLEDIRRGRETYYEKPPRPVLDVLTDSRYQYAIILGDPGSGKSTLARYVVLALIDHSSNEKLRHSFGGYLPLLIELRSYSGLCMNGDCKTFLEFLEFLGKTEGWALAQSSLHNHLKNDSRAVVIFDGLDEIFDPGQREQITRQIVGFCNDYPNVRIIVTSRVIGYRRKILTDAGFTHFTLQDLSEKQVGAFVMHWYDLAMIDRPEEAKERRERILKSFKDSPSIRQLAGNPMLLTIMAIIGKHQELPRERWKLYDHAASVLIQHWDVNKHLKNESIEADFIGEDDKKEFLRRLAFRMQSGDGGLAGNYIHRDGLQAEFESYLKERYNQTPDRAKVIAEVMIQQFRERNFILSLYGANLYGFVHRAFLEYFCASAFVHKFEKAKELDIEQLKIDVYGKHWEDQSWHEVLQLVCGIIDEKWVEKIIDYLVVETYRPWPISFGNRQPWNIVLAAKCLGEVRNLSIVSTSAGKLLESICLLIEKFMSTGDSELNRLLQSQILPTIEVIGSNWPQREFVLNWLEKLRVNQYTFLPYTGILIGNFVGSISEGMVSIHDVAFDYLVKGGSSWHCLTLALLGKCCKDSSKTQQILIEGSLNPDMDIRQTAISILGEQSNPESLQLLRKTASDDAIGKVRKTAILRLTRSHNTDPQTWLFVRDCCIKDQDHDVHDTAITTLIEHIVDDPGDIDLLTEVAREAKCAGLRVKALDARMKYSANDTQFFLFVYEQVIKNKDAKLRKTVVSLFAMPDDGIKKQFLSFLRAHSQKETKLSLRSRTKELLTAIEKGKSRSVFAWRGQFSPPNKDS